MIGLFLDDERNPEDVTWIKYPDNVEWVVVRNSEQFVDASSNMMVSCKDFIVSLDHDIQEFKFGEEINGYSVLKAMLEFTQLASFKTPKCYFHTKTLLARRTWRCITKIF